MKMDLRKSKGWFHNDCENALKLVEKYFLGLIGSRSLPKCDLNYLHKTKLYQRSQLRQKDLTVISFPFCKHTIQLCNCISSFRKSNFQITARSGYTWLLSLAKLRY